MPKEVNAVRLLLLPASNKLRDLRDFDVDTHTSNSGGNDMLAVGIIQSK